MRIPLPRPRLALALPLVLWAIAFIAGLVVLVAGTVGDWIDEEAQAGRSFRARQMALSGLAFGLNPAVNPGDALLKSGNPDDEGYEVRISNEAGRINPNFWIAANDRTIFVQLFDYWGVDERLRDQSVDSLIDWIDGDDFRSLAGAERGEYTAIGRAGFPANRPLAHIRELPAVMGFDTILASQPQWRDLFSTVHNGKINIQYATEPILRALARLTPEQITALFELRAGPDGIEGNDDDVRFESMETVIPLIGSDGVQQAALETWFDVTGDVRRVESTGYCQGTKHRITVLSSGGGGEVLSWEEQ